MLALLGAHPILHDIRIRVKEIPTIMLQMCCKTTKLSANCISGALALGLQDGEATRISRQSAHESTRGADKSLARIDNSYVEIKHISCLSSL